MSDPTAEFEPHRPLLLGLAYRLLGSMWDAEDVVSEAYLRWSSTDRQEVRDARAYLLTVVTRLGLDHLRSARVKRETYPGPWLPEPVATDRLGPLDTVEMRDTVAFATLHLMERLSPPERAVFVLREAFGFGYDEIADLVEKSPDNCRQLHHRARLHLSETQERFAPSTQEHSRLVQEFLVAAQTGDIARLTDLLTEDVTVWNDGGGKVRAALRPISGRAKVVAFLAGLLSRHPITGARFTDANGGIGLVIEAEGRDQFVSFGIRDGRIDRMYAVLNPEKQAHLADVLRVWLSCSGAICLTGSTIRAPASRQGAGMQVDEALTTTRAVRKRLDLERPVAREVVQECLELALQAPNGSNRQLWRWILIDDPGIKVEVAKIYRAGMAGYSSTPASADNADKPRQVDYTSPEALRISSSVLHLRDHLEDVPVLVIPLLADRMDGASIFYQASMWGSVLPAVWSFMLALRSRGMGSVWTTIHLHREAEMAELLGIPPAYTQVGLFPVAYTIGTDFRPGGRRRIEDVVSWNGFALDSAGRQEPGDA